MRARWGDARADPEISPASVFLALFHAFVFRLPSLQQLDIERSHSYLRLLARLPELYGRRFFDILLLDSLYAQAPLLRLAKRIGGEVVISLKQEKRALYQDALGLFQARGPDQTFTELPPGKTYAVRLGEEFGLPFSQDHPQPLRAVRTPEKLSAAHYRGRQKQTETTSHEWPWITTLSAALAAAVVRQLGHARWKNENNGGMDLTQHWALKHGFLHACRHRPQRRQTCGQRELVPNHGLAAVTLILLIAFALCSAFVLRHCKLARLHHLTALAVAAQLRSRAAQAPPSIRGPT